MCGMFLSRTQRAVSFINSKPRRCPSSVGRFLSRAHRRLPSRMSPIHCTCFSCSDTIRLRYVPSAEPSSNHAADSMKNCKNLYAWYNNQVKRTPKKPNKKRRKNVHYSFLPLLTGSDLSSRKLPIMETQSKKAGLLCG